MKTTNNESHFLTPEEFAHYPWEQPPGSYRFSADALLLADFAARSAPSGECTVADLGCGCGVVGLTLNFQKPRLRITGLDTNPELVETARKNAAALGINSYTAMVGDVGDPASLKAMKSLAGPCSDASGFGMVVCNPPWQIHGKGRRSPSSARNAALFGDESTLASFFSAADTLLTAGGILNAACGASRLQDALTALPARLHPVTLRFVHGRAGKEASFFLLRAVKNSRAALHVEPPLILNG